MGSSLDYCYSKLSFPSLNDLMVSNKMVCVAHPYLFSCLSCAREVWIVGVWPRGICLAELGELAETGTLDMWEANSI